MTLSLPPEASQRLSELKATAFADLMCPVCRINSGLSLGVAGVADAGVCVRPEGIPSPRFSCSFDCAMPRTGAQITDSKSIAADICRRRRSDKCDPFEATCLAVESLLFDRLVRTIGFS